MQRTFTDPFGVHWRIDGPFNAGPGEVGVWRGEEPWGAPSPPPGWEAEEDAVLWAWLTPGTAVERLSALTGAPDGAVAGRWITDLAPHFAPVVDNPDADGYPALYRAAARRPPVTALAVLALGADFTRPLPDPARTPRTAFEVALAHRDLELLRAFAEHGRTEPGAAVNAAALMAEWARRDPGAYAVYAALLSRGGLLPGFSAPGLGGRGR